MITENHRKWWEIEIILIIHLFWRSKQRRFSTTKISAKGPHALSSHLFLISLFISIPGSKNPCLKWSNVYQNPAVRLKEQPTKTNSIVILILNDNSRASTSTLFSFHTPQRWCDAQMSINKKEMNNKAEFLYLSEYSRRYWMLKNDEIVKR